MASDIRFVLTRYRNGILAYSVNVHSPHKSRLETVHFYAGYGQNPAEDGQNSDQNGQKENLGDIFVAKVMNIAGNIHAAFIDYQKGKHGYLSTAGIVGTPVLLNRVYDGRLKAGDEILVQLEKEAVRSKEPVFTTNLSLAGKYCVITSGNQHKGVSRKCAKSVRERLLQAIPAEIHYGIVVRTNAGELVADGDHNDDTGRLALLSQECMLLSRQMDTLLNEGIHRTCYSKVWQSPPPYLTILRDMRNLDYSQVVTDDANLYGELSDFLKQASPELAEKLNLYTDSNFPLNKLYSIETRLEELLSPRVWLKSGAYLVIEKTEAMYVIDVNSGKNISKKPSEEYILSINMEAAKEVLYQVRLRNLTGIIVVDFINMQNPADKETLLSELRKGAAQDMVQTTIIDMTALDLVEITRQKNAKSLSEQMQS